MTVADTVRTFAGGVGRAFRFTPSELIVLAVLSLVVSPALFFGVFYRTFSFFPPPEGSDFLVPESPPPSLAVVLAEWAAGWALATLVLLFMVMLLTRARSPESTAPGIGRLTASCYLAPWIWLVLLGAMTAVMSVMPARNWAIPAVHEDPFLQPLFVRVLSPYGTLALLCALALALVSPAVVTGDVLWRIGRRETMRSWAPRLAVYAIGLALMGVLVLGNAFGLWVEFFMWYLD